MDVKALYPSLDVQKTAECVEEIIVDSEIKFRNVDMNELSRYVAVVCDENMIEERGLTDVVMRRRKTGGRRPLVTGNEMKKKWKDLEESIWAAPMRDANEVEVKKLPALAVRTDVEHIMKNNLFKFDGVMYVQSEGGMIGSELICVIAKSRMILYIRKLKRRAEIIGLRIVLAWVYVDDTFIVAKKVCKGLLVKDSSSLGWSETKAIEDAQLPGDVVTARVISDVANQIEDDIVMTFDAPSMNEDGRMPVLDLKVWMTEDFHVKFKFYEKDMASKVTILKDSALTWTCKKVILAGEVSRRMFNTSPDLVADGRAEDDIDRFMYKLMNSGYNARDRNIIEGEGSRRYENV